MWIVVERKTVWIDGNEVNEVDQQPRKVSLSNQDSVSQCDIHITDVTNNLPLKSLSPTTPLPISPIPNLPDSLQNVHRARQLPYERRAPFPLRPYTFHQYL